MTAIAWAIIVSAIVTLPEDKGLKQEAKAFVGVSFTFSVLMLLFCTARELFR